METHIISVFRELSWRRWRVIAFATFAALAICVVLLEKAKFRVLPVLISQHSPVRFLLSDHHLALVVIVVLCAGVALATKAPSAILAPSAYVQSLNASLRTFGVRFCPRRGLMLVPQGPRPPSVVVRRPE